MQLVSVGLVDAAVSAPGLRLDADAVGADDVVGEGAKCPAAYVVIALEVPGLILSGLADFLTSWLAVIVSR